MKCGWPVPWSRVFPLQGCGRRRCWSRCWSTWWMGAGRRRLTYWSTSSTARTSSLSTRYESRLSSCFKVAFCDRTPSYGYLMENATLQVHVFKLQCLSYIWSYCAILSVVHQFSLFVAIVISMKLFTSCWNMKLLHNLASFKNVPLRKSPIQHHIEWKWPGFISDIF